jgi:hypothetical protein
MCRQEDQLADRSQVIWEDVVEVFDYRDRSRVCSALDSGQMLSSLSVWAGRKCGDRMWMVSPSLRGAHVSRAAPELRTKGLEVFSRAKDFVCALMVRY